MGLGERPHPGHELGEVFATRAVAASYRGHVPAGTPESDREHTAHPPRSDERDAWLALIVVGVRLPVRMLPVSMFVHVCRLSPDGHTMSDAAIEASPEADPPREGTSPTCCIREVGFPGRASPWVWLLSQRSSRGPSWAWWRCCGEVSVRLYLASARRSFGLSGVSPHWPSRSS